MVAQAGQQPGKCNNSTSKSNKSRRDGSSSNRNSSRNGNARTKSRNNKKSELPLQALLTLLLVLVPLATPGAAVPAASGLQERTAEPTEPLASSSNLKNRITTKKIKRLVLHLASADHHNHQQQPRQPQQQQLQQPHLCQQQQYQLLQPQNRGHCCTHVTVLSYDILNRHCHH